MLNKILMSGRLISEPVLVTEDGSQNCRFRIAVDRPKRKEIATVETDIFNCIAFDRNAEMVNDLFSSGEVITFVGTLRNSPDNLVEIVVEEVHISNAVRAVSNIPF